jgi:hypothetical protein
VKSFIITGLPRSRTAWLSNFLTSGNIFCFHEASNGCYSWQDLGNKIDKALEHYDIVGNADSALAVSPNLCEIAEHVPTIIIERSIEDVSNSLKDLYETDDPIIDSMLYEMQKNLDAVECGLRIHYEDIDNRLEDIWNFCTNNSPYDANRAEHLIKMNIQTEDIWGDPESINFLMQE